MNFQPPPALRVTIPGPAGAIEAVLEEPSSGSSGPTGPDAGPAAFAVICHPHPLHGGTLTNKVVHTLARAFQELGMPTVRFNFRGVGASAGSYDAGRGEVDDALAVIDWSRARWPSRRPWLAGFSFGAFVAARAAGRVAADRVVLVAPPVGRFEELRQVDPPRVPWLVVQGDADELVEVDGVRAWVRALVPAPALVVLPGVDHFFHGRLHDLKDAVLTGVTAR